MIKHLKELCAISGASGNEADVAAYIYEHIAPYCECRADVTGNLIAFKKGASRPVKKVMLDAHMDEVGFIVTSVSDDGFLYFSVLGGINMESLLAKRVQINGHTGVIQVKPIHLLHGDEAKKMPVKKDLTIDIGAKSRDEALELVQIGDIGTFESTFTEFGRNCIKAKAIDDRVGCAILMNLLERDLPYDMWFSFSVQEELGLRGAKTAAFGIQPDCALVIEATTAADLTGVPEEKQVCRLGRGAVVSFMDSATLYEPKLYRAALEIAEKKNIPVQSKQAVAGGNNSGSIHLTGSGIRTFTISVPCRYLHSPSCVIQAEDADSVLSLAYEMAVGMASGAI